MSTKRNQLSRSELVSLCRLRRLSTYGTKKDLIQRLNRNSKSLHRKKSIWQQIHQLLMIYPIQMFHKNKQLLSIVIILSITYLIGIHHYIYNIPLCAIRAAILSVFNLITKELITYIIYNVYLIVTCPFRLIWNMIIYLLSNTVCISLIILCIQHGPRYLGPYQSHTTIYEIEWILCMMDLILFIYCLYLEQYIISALFLLIIIANAWRQTSDYLETTFPGLREITLFHTTFQLLPISLSLAFYDTNDTFIDIMLIFIFVVFMYQLYKFSNKWSFAGDNDTKIIWIIFLCVILDYIHTIMSILCNLYVTNNLYFYQVIPTEIFCIILGVVILYNEFFVYRYRYHHDDGIWDFFWMIIWFFIGLPFCLEWGKMTWIAFIYGHFLKNLRHETHFNDGKCKDLLVEWLQKHQHDVLIKLCCITHIKLIDTDGSNADYQLLAYLEDNANRYHRNYYKNVSWNGIQQNAVNFKDVESLLNTLINDIKTGFDELWNGFMRNLNLANHHNNAKYAFLICLVYYVICRILHIFVLPCYILWTMYNVINVYQAWFIVMYFMLLVYIVYKLWILFQYERIMWYVIPDLKDLDCSQQEIKIFKKYYQYIKRGRFEIEETLDHIIGIDIATLIMIYLPDFIDLHKKKGN